MPRVNEEGWAGLESQRANLQPTPPVGCPDIVWYPAGNTNDPVPARVTAIEGPGRLKLVVFPKNAFPAHKQAVYHVSAKIHDKPGNPTTKNWGSWDYVEKEDLRDSHYNFHRAELQKLEDNLTRGEEEAQRAAENYLAKQAEKMAAAKSGKKKPLEPLIPAT